MINCCSSNSKSKLGILSKQVCLRLAWRVDEIRRPQKEAEPKDVSQSDFRGQTGRDSNFLLDHLEVT